MIGFICAHVEEPSDQEFMIHLYNEYQRLMFHTAKKYISSPNDQEDVVQDAILCLIRHLDTLRKLEDYRLAVYIVAAVRNTAISLLRKQSRVKRYEEDVPDEELGSASIYHVDLDHGMHVKDMIMEAWEKLSEEDVYLLEGKYIIGYSHAELAQQMGCSEGSVRTRLSRARRRALEHLSDDEKAKQSVGGSEV